MLAFALRRIAVWLPSLGFILLAIYLIAYYGAGDPIKLIFLRSPGEIAFDPVRIEAMRKAAGLDRPVLEQFGVYCLNLLQGNFGNSLVSGQPVGRMLAGAAPVTLQLSLVTLVITALVAIPIGIAAALNAGRWIDRVILGVAMAFWAIPPYVIGPLALIALLILFPANDIALGWHGLLDGRVILPLAVLSLQPIALVVRQTRAVVTEILTENYIRSARAKGLPQRVLIFRHILRPALTPVVTQLGLIAITLINGAVFVELVFGLPGLGRLTVTAMTDADYPLILGVTLLGALAVMICNLLVELIYPFLDPRVTASGGSER